MPTPEQALYATPAMRALLRAETAMVRTCVSSRMGRYGLFLTMQRNVATCADSAAHWLHMYRYGDDWAGAVRTRGSESLPFADATFSVVRLSQAHQHGVDGKELLSEAVRVTVPGGVLVLTGLHPLSAWAPWALYCLRGSGRTLHLNTPMQLVRTMGDSGCNLQDIRRFGPILPRAASAGGVGAHMLGGGYLVVARKSRQNGAPLHAHETVRSANVATSLAPGAHRDSG